MLHEGTVSSISWMNQTNHQTLRP